MSGTLYAPADSFRTKRILIAAEYNGSKINLDRNFKLGETNATGDFLKKFPFGKVPAFVSNDGKSLFETLAISCFVGKSVAGTDEYSQAQVLQWCSFADQEVLPAVLGWTLPSISAMHYIKQQVDESKNELLRLLHDLDSYLLSRTYLVGERISLADIAMCCNLLPAFQHVLEAEVRKPFVNVNRWFDTLINQPEFKKILGTVKACEKAAQFDAKKFKEIEGATGGGAAAPAKDRKESGFSQSSEINGEQVTVTEDSSGSSSKKKKGKKDKKKDKEHKEQKGEQPKEQNEQKKEAPKKEKKPAAHEEEDAAENGEMDATEMALAAEPKQKDPFEAFPKGTFNMDEFKRVYSNEDTVTKAIPYFWEHFDKENYSVWYCEYKFPQELTLVFMSCNLIAGMYQRLEKMRKHAFGSMCLLGVDNKSTISGVWIWRSQELAFTLSDDWQTDFESYTWKKLDPTNADAKKIVNEYFAWEGEFNGKKFNQGKIFK